jgi:hypothetical protein
MQPGRLYQPFKRICCLHLSLFYPEEGDRIFYRKRYYIKLHSVTSSTLHVFLREMTNLEFSLHLAERNGNRPFRLSSKLESAVLRVLNGPPSFTSTLHNNPVRSFTSLLHLPQLTDRLRMSTNAPFCCVHELHSHKCTGNTDVARISLQTTQL